MSLFGSLAVPRARPFQEQGVSGTAVQGGYVVTREKSSKWTGQQRYVTITDMAVNTSIIAAGLHYFLNLIAHPQWTLQPADESAEAQEVADFVEEVLHGLQQPWSRVVRRAGTYRFYGFAILEWRAVRRPDGKVGLASVESRPQSTIEQWAVADDGTVEGVVQRGRNDGRVYGIPRSKLLYLVDDVLTDSPEGVGIFRHLAEPWERLNKYYELEAQVFERDLRGIPVGRAPYTLINEMVANGDLSATEAAALTRGLEDFVKLAAKQSNTGITFDSLAYESQAADGRKVSSIPQWSLDLLQGAANGVDHLGEAIKRTQHEMARIIGNEAMMMGETSGNRSLGEDKSRNLYLVANAVLGDIVAGTNLDIVPRICDLNAIPEELRPVCDAEDVAFKDAESVARVLKDMATAGAVLAPDDPVVEDVRALLGVSPPDPTPVEVRGLEEEPEDDDEDEDDDTELEEDGTVAKAEPKTLYVSRPLLNGEEVRDWAARQGIRSTLAPEDMHVTIAFSRTPVNWGNITPDPFRLTVLSEAGGRDVHQFPPRSTPNGAVVLRFASNQLTRRHEKILAAGASWDFPEFQPHITLTYSVAEADVGAIEPYTGPLIFGPEMFAEVNDDWAGDITEVPTKKRGVPRIRSRRM